MKGEPMKSRRFWFSIIIVAIFLGAFGSVLLGAEDANQRSELQTLQAKIDTLEETIRTQQEHITRTKKTLSDVKKQLDEQIEENKRLRLLCEKAGIDTTGKAPQSFSPDRPIVYRRQERTKEWFERMYKQFSDKIALLNGKFVDIGKIGDITKDYRSEPPEQVGAIVQIPSGCKVISVIRDSEVLLTRLDNPDFVFHVTGYDGPLLSDDQIFPYTGKLICVGTYKYTAAFDAQKTVQSFKVWQPKPLTREQFAEAISSGFELVNYVEQGGKTIKKPIR